MPGKTPQKNGKKPAENGLRSGKDVEASKSKGKKAAKDGDEEMTVVVPPSKASKPSSGPPADTDGDVSMGDEDKEEQVDPAVQAIAGMWNMVLRWPTTAHAPQSVRAPLLIRNLL